MRAEEDMILMVHLMNVPRFKGVAAMHAVGDVCCKFPTGTERWLSSKQKLLAWVKSASHVCFILVLIKMGRF